MTQESNMNDEADGEVLLTLVDGMVAIQTTPGLNLEDMVLMLSAALECVLQRIDGGELVSQAATPAMMH